MSFVPRSRRGRSGFSVRLQSQELGHVYVDTVPTTTTRGGDTRSYLHDERFRRNQQSSLPLGSGHSSPSTPSSIVHGVYRHPSVRVIDILLGTS